MESNYGSYGMACADFSRSSRQDPTNADVHGKQTQTAQAMSPQKYHQSFDADSCSVPESRTVTSLTPVSEELSRDMKLGGISEITFHKLNQLRNEWPAKATPDAWAQGGADGVGITLDRLSEQGAHGQIFTLKWKGEPKEYILKIGLEGHESRMENEPEIYSRLWPESSCRVKVYAAGTIKGIPFVIMEKGSTDLITHIKNEWNSGQKPKQQDVMNIGYCMSSALSDLHDESKYIHRDIKGNSFVKCGDDWKLCNFDQAISESDVTRTPHSESLEFAPPECSPTDASPLVPFSQNWSYSADSWAFGIVLLQSLHMMSKEDTYCFYEPTGNGTKERLNKYKTLSEFYKNLGKKKIRGKKLSKWIKKLTGLNIEAFINTGKKVPAYDSVSSTPWEVQCALVALCCLSQDPDFRLKASVLHEWFSSSKPRFEHETTTLSTLL